jgi:hypothetical protein
MRKPRTSVACEFLSLFLCLYLAPTVSQADAQVFATGLTGPVKLDVTQRGTLLVTERGTGDNDGRLSLVDDMGNVRPLLRGLPSGIDLTNEPNGPNAGLRRGCCVVYVAMSEGDTSRFDPAGPPKQVPNPVASVSPIFSSVLRFVFSHPIDQLNGEFELTPQDYETLADGFTVPLQNDVGEKVRVRLVADLKDFRPDPVTNIRGSNPFGMTRGSESEGLLIADAAANSVVQIHGFQPPKTLLRFPPVPNTSGVGPPVSDAVPTSIRHLQGSRFLVTLLTGIPFTPGAASVREVDIQARTESVLISGLTSATDVLPIGSDLYVLEISTNLSQGLPGRLLRFSSPSANPEVIANGLIGPSGMVHVPGQRAIFIAEIFAGRISRVDL